MLQRGYNLNHPYSPLACDVKRHTTVRCAGVLFMRLIYQVLPHHTVSVVAPGEFGRCHIRTHNHCETLLTKLDGRECPKPCPNFLVWGEQYTINKRTRGSKALIRTPNLAQSANQCNAINSPCRLTRSVRMPLHF